MVNGEVRHSNALEGADHVPTVSIIIPAYKTAAYIGETLKSVTEQTFTDYEAIVVNDGAPDTVEIEQALKPYLDHIIYLKQENRGLSGADATRHLNVHRESTLLCSTAMMRGSPVISRNK